MTVLVGGRNDAKEVGGHLGGMTRLVMPVQPDHAFEISEGIMPTEIVSMAMETYHRMEFRGEREIHHVFALQGFTADQVLWALLRSYSDRGWAPTPISTSSAREGGRVISFVEEK